MPSVPYKRDWQGYEVDVPREEQCRRTFPGRRKFCDRAKGHTGNHRAGYIQWGQGVRR